MAQYITLELLKKHVRSDDFTEDDGYLSHLADAAEAWVLDATARDADDLIEMGGGVFPFPLVQAMLLLAGHWYNQREAVYFGSAAPVPYTVDALVKPYRKLSDTDSGGGGGDYDELEERVTALEGKVAEIEETMPAIEMMTPAEVESAWDDTMGN